MIAIPDKRSEVLEAGATLTAAELSAQCRARFYRQIRIRAHHARADPRPR